MRLGAAVRIRGSWRSNDSADETREAIPGALDGRQAQPKQPEFTVREITILGDSDPGVGISIPPSKLPHPLALPV